MNIRDMYFPSLPAKTASVERTDMIFVSANGEDPYIHFKQLAESFRIQDSDLQAAGMYLVERRREQTMAGIDSYGQPFQQYSPSYEQKKRQSNVDLRSHLAEVHMLDALTFRSHPDSRRETLRMLEIGIFGDMELIGRARIHDQGAVVKTSTYSRMLPSGRLKKRGRSDNRRYARKLFAIIPQRKWLDPTPGEIEEATKIVADGIARRVEFADTPGHKENFVNVSSTRNAGRHFNIPKEGGKIL